MRKRAYLYARDMVWNKAAQSYMSTFVRARSDRTRIPRIAFSDLNAERTLDRLPPVEHHLYRMTDQTEFLQHRPLGRSICFPAQDSLAEISVLARISNET